MPADGSVERSAVTGTVVAAARDGAGNRWFGMYGNGVTRLGPDGSVTRIHAADGVGLTYDLVLNMATDRTGRVWVLSGDYFRREDALVFQPAVDIVDAAGVWAHVDTTGWVQDGGIRDVAFDTAGDAWFASDEGLFAPQSGGTWHRETDTATSDLTFDSSGVLWAASRKGLTRRDPSGEWRTLARGALPGSSVSSIDVGADGTAWFGTGGGGLARLGTDGSWNTYSEPDGLFGPGAHAVEVDESGGVWFASGAADEEGGIQYLAPDGTLSGYRIADGLVSGSVLDIALEPDGGVWVAGGSYFYAPGQRRDGGVSHRAPGGEWQRYLEASGLPRGGDVQALVLGSDTPVWAGSDVITGAPDESLARLLPNGMWEIVPLPPSAPGFTGSNGVNDLALDASGTLWIATEGRVVALLRGGNFPEWLTPEDDPALDFWADAIAVDQTDAVWFGVSDGVRIRHPDGSWESITQADGLGFAMVETIAIGPDGRAWLAGRDGGVTVVTP
jgi:ligand-binding sensor domain-containing protein